jgi:hypothetical protein
VLRKSHRDQIGYIADDPRLFAGEYWYQVQFGGGIAKKVHESDLEPYEGAQDIDPDESGPPDKDWRDTSVQ